MNTYEAKQLNLPELMARMGYYPTAIKRDGNEYWYQSPFRSEKEASFHSSFLGGKWIWKDFGDTGGTVIDFIIRHEGFKRVGEALNYLEVVCSGESRDGALKGSKYSNEPNLFSFQQQSSEAAQISESPDQLEFLELGPITNPVIYDYLERRGIPQIVANQYLQEVKYLNKNNGRTYFAFGMENDSGGFEIRVASDRYSFKSSLKKKDITTISGNSPEHRILNVFEGMTDFLSLLVMLNVSNLSGDSIIMHSLSSFQRSVERIYEREYEKINTYLDNNRAGQENTAEFIKTFGEKVASQSILFEPYEDLNDALRNNEIEKW